MYRYILDIFFTLFSRELELIFIKYSRLHEFMIASTDVSSNCSRYQSFVWQGMYSKFLGHLRV